MGRMRVTQHNGRVRKSGQPYSPKHNDRNFDVAKSDNIDPDRVARNQYWSCAAGKAWYRATDEGKPAFEDVEREFYEAHFMPMYEASKERSKKRGQLKRVKPFEEWRKARQFVPEETHVQIGSVEGTVPIRVFVACATEYVRAMKDWNDQHGEPFTLLDMALHLDEAVPHLQIRRVWHSVDPVTGIDEIGQAKALERAGVDPPDPSAPISKENNRKQTYDAYMREQWIAICEAHGLDIERVPEPERPHNQTKEEHIRDKQKARTAELDSREAAVIALEQMAQGVKEAADEYARDVVDGADEYARKVKQKADTDAQKATEKAVQDGQAIRQAAALDARQTRQEARSEAASLKQSGYEDGYDEGEEEARKTVMEDFKRSTLAKLLGDQITRDVREVLEAGLPPDLVKLLPGE